MTSSRTSNSIKNSAVALLLYLINLILNFFSRQAFIQILGADVLGLNTTATSLLQFLNLAELGIGSAISCTLYKPILNNDQKTINEIISLQGWLYRKIAWIVIGGSVIIMCFFPWIFQKMTLPLWYAFASFGVLLFSALLSYFINYKQVALSASQQEYKINYSYKMAMLIKILFQILAIKYFTNGYLWWLILEVVFAIVAAIALNYTIFKTFPNLKTDLSHGKNLRIKYPEVVIKIKQLFFHKISAFILSQTSPLIIYSYISLTLVAIYGNYLLITTGLSALLTAIYNGMNASIGNLVAEGNKKNVIGVFKEIFISRFIIIITLCYCLFTLSAPFITLWVGKEYVLDNISLALIILIFYIQAERGTVNSYIYAYGLFSDIWAPIAEAVLNLSLSIILGYYWGLHGILSGSFISILLIVFIWKPYFLFKKGFKIKIQVYIKMYAKLILITIITISITEYIRSFIRDISISTYSELLIIGILSACIFGITLTTFLAILEQGMRDFIKRFINLIIKKYDTKNC